jgi:hypothetical protein
MTDLFRAVPGYQRYIHDAGRQPLFFLLLSFLATFIVARAFTRIGRARGWRSGSLAGAHLHHFVPGVIACLFAGTAIIAFRPADDLMLVMASLFGFGAALVLDEFALILHLDDVYWTAEGRSSIEATLMGFAFGSLCLLASAPVGSRPADDVPHWAVAGILTLNLALALVCFLKGKPRLGTIGILIPGVAAIGALRLGLPSSLWARRFYSALKLSESARREQAQHRRYTHLRHRIYDTIGGAPHADRPTAPRQ